MIILNRNVTTVKGDMLAGQDVEGVLSEDTCSDLLKRGWAHRPGKSGDKEIATQEEQHEAVDPETLSDDDVLEIDEESLSKLKVDELKELAKDLEIEGYANMKKAELIAVLIDSAEEGESE